MHQSAAGTLLTLSGCKGVAGVMEEARVEAGIFFTRRAISLQKPTVMAAQAGGTNDQKRTCTNKLRTVKKQNKNKGNLKE